MSTIEYKFDNVLFEWDSDKADLVIKEHDVSFDEALTVLLYDDNAVTNSDTRDYDGEERFITIGMSSKGRILNLTWTVRSLRYRMINVRKANKHEKRGYQNG